MLIGTIDIRYLENENNENERQSQLLFVSYYVYFGFSTTIDAYHHLLPLSPFSYYYSNISRFL